MLSTITSNIFKGLRTLATVQGPQFSQTGKLPPPSSTPGPGLGSGRHITVKSGWFPPYGTYTYRMNLEPYTPEMIDVKVVNGEIVVHGKIEEFVGEDKWTYEFVKRHKLPLEVDRNTVQSKFENGQLVVTAKLKDQD